MTKKPASMEAKIQAVIRSCRAVTLVLEAEVEAIFLLALCNESLIPQNRDPITR